MRKHGRASGAWFLIRSPLVTTCIGSKLALVDMWLNLVGLKSLKNDRTAKNKCIERHNYDVQNYAEHVSMIVYNNYNNSVCFRSNVGHAQYKV